MVHNCFPDLPSGLSVGTPIPFHRADYGIGFPAMDSGKSGERAVAAQDQSGTESFNPVISVLHAILPGVPNDDKQTLTDWSKVVKEIFSQEDKSIRSAS